jgi:hypothetical protein
MSQKPLTPSPAVWLHILFGDSSGGGHLSGYGSEGKTEFPSYWTLARIENAVLSALENIRARENELSHGGYDEFVDGIYLRVAITLNCGGEPEVLSAFPLRGNGVFQIQGGVRKSRPLLRQDRRK